MVYSFSWSNDLVTDHFSASFSCFIIFCRVTMAGWIQNFYCRVTFDCVYLVCVFTGQIRVPDNKVMLCSCLDICCRVLSCCVSVLIYDVVLWHAQTQTKTWIATPTFKIGSWHRHSLRYSLRISNVTLLIEDSLILYPFLHAVSGSWFNWVVNVTYLTLKKFIMWLCLY